MPLKAADIKPFCGAWVKVMGEHPWAWNRAQGYSDFRPHEFEGLMGRNVTDSTDDVVFIPIREGFREYLRVLHIEELWRPAKNAVRYVCNICAKSSPVGKACVDGYPSFSITTKACSLCGKTARYDAPTTPGLRGVYQTDVSLWQFGEHKELLEHLNDLEFRRKLESHNSKFYIFQASVSHQKIEGHAGRVWEIDLRSNIGAFLRTWAVDPPTVVDWETWFDLEELKKRFVRGRCNDGLIAWGWEAKS